MSDTTPRLTLPLVGDHSQKRIVMNAALMRLESLVQARVLSRTTAAQPSSPGDGDAYILPAGPTGAVWGSLAAGTFVRSESATWETVAFPDGAIVHIADENRFVIKSGVGWAAFEDVLKALDNLTHVGIGTVADSTNVLALKGPAALLSGQYAADGGSGDMSLNLNKEADGDTAQLLLQKNYSTRAILGLLGDNHLTLKVSPDGSAYTTALTVNATTGVASLNGLTVKDSALTLQDDGDASKQARFELSALSTATTRTYSLPNVTATLAHTGASAQTFAGQMNLSNGSAAAPQLAFNSNYGLYYEATPLQSGSVGMAMALNGVSNFQYVRDTGNGQVRFIAAADAQVTHLTWCFSNTATGAFVLRRSRGTQASSSYPLQNDSLGSVNFAGGSTAGNVVGAQIIGTVIEAAPSATAMGSQLSISLCQLGSTTRSEVVRLEYATGLSMYGANPVIDQNRNLRARLYTAAGLPPASPAGQRAMVSDAASPVFAAIITGGGSTCAPVYSDGANWCCG